MSFLHGSLFAALLPLALLPLAIHLLNLRFPKLFAFSSVKHLRETVAQQSRLHRWRHLLLLALRTLFVLALLFAFLQPLLPRLGSAGAGEKGRTVLLVVDRSMSMEHLGGGVSGRQRAESEAGKILATLGAEDAVNVITADATPKAAFTRSTSNTAEARRVIGALAPGLGRADFSAANALAGRLLAASEGRREIYYLSDFQRRTWASVDFTALPPETRLFFVDVAAAHRENRAILGATIDQSHLLAGDTVSLEVEVGNFRDAALQESLRVIVDAQSSFEKEVSVAPWSTARFTLPIPVGAPGLHQCEVSLAPDDLAADDRFVLTLPVQEKEGVLVVTDTPEPRADAVRFLETALNPYENLAGSLLPRRVGVAAILPTELAAARKIFLTRAGRLDDAAAAHLARFVFHGGGIVWFLDGEHEAANLAALERALDGSRLPLRVGARRSARHIATGAQQILRGDFKSRYLRLFQGAQRQNLALLEFYDIHDAAPTGAGGVLLHYADDTPAMAALHHGLGTLLLMNFSVSEFSSNLARQRVFPAWMQDLVKCLASEEPAPTSSVIGAAVHDEVWKSDLDRAPLRRPSGAPLAIRTEPLGERTAISFTPDEPGFYTRRADRLLHSYAVNPDPEESDLRPIDRTRLPAQAAETGQRGFFVASQEDLRDLVRGKPIFHWFLLAGLALLVAELAVQYLTRMKTT
jgi:hypothetical protein